MNQRNRIIILGDSRFAFGITDDKALTLEKLKTAVTALQSKEEADFITEVLIVDNFDEVLNVSNSLSKITNDYHRGVAQNSLILYCKTKNLGYLGRSIDIIRNFDKTFITTKVASISMN